MALDMTVGKRIGLGFSIVIVITVVIGGLGVWNMLTAKNDSTKLATEYVPEVKVATDLRGGANRVMYEMLGYSMSEEEQFYKAAQEEMDAVRTHLEEADDLASKAIHLTAMKGQVQDAKNAVDEYAKLMEETTNTIAMMNIERKKLDDNAASYMANCNEFIEGQNQAFKQDLSERQRKVALVTDIVNLGTKVRVTNFKAQAANDMDTMQEAIDSLAGLNRHTEELRPITRDADYLKKIDDTETAARKYAASMSNYIETNRVLESAGKQMDEAAGAYMENCSAFLEKQNEKMQGEFAQAGANLEERLQKITLVNDIIDAGNDVRIRNFKGQAQKNPKLIEAAMATLKGVKDITGELRKITQESADLKRIDDTEEAADTYMTAMEGYLKNYLKLSDIRSEMDNAAGQYVAQCASFLEGQQEKLSQDMHERHAKISLVNDVINLGNDTRVKAFKSQATRSPQIIQDALNNFPLMDKKYASLKDITKLQKDLERIDNTKDSGDAYASALTSFLGGWNKLQELGARREKVGQQVIAACKTTADAGMSNTDKIATAAASSLAQNSTIMSVGLVIGTIIAIIAALWITRSITGPLNRIIVGLNEGADQVNDAAGQVSSSSQNLAEGASEQASALEETSSSLEQMAAMTQTNAKNATEANTRMEETKRIVADGDNAMSEASDAMNQISDASEQISKIIKVIEEIAFQTNLLALNAAVEAARAGEHGKGFAVVADEVRNLAQRAAEAAKETGDLIEQTTQRVASGVQLNKTTSESFVQIKDSAEQVASLVNQIAQASQEQAQGVDQVNTAVSQMDKVTQTNASGAEESASAAEELAAQAQAVKGMVDELAAMVGAKNSGGSGKTSVSSPAKKTTGHTVPPRERLRMQPAGVSSGDDFLPIDDEGIRGF